MFFILSKLLTFVISPLVWIITFLLLALFLKNKKIARRFLYSSVILILFFSNPFIADELCRMWEYPITQDKDLAATYDVGIVLGGGMVTIDTDYDRMTFRHNTDRIFQALQLYKTGRIKKMLISSGSGSLVFRDMIESTLLKRYLLKIGIPDSAVIIDSLSENTYQNAVNSAQILKKAYPKGKFLLITSSSHLRRAKACFIKTGITVTPYSTNLITGRRLLNTGNMIIPNLSAFDAWDKILHEVIGYIVYKVCGYL
ncbi:MAG: YdcF family protein [Bacteroidetes bacterium]|nr:YdcF family protein [Bacteroidota bacterium]